MITTIYMVRHAESPYIAGQERTRGLSEAGAAAAARVSVRLRGYAIDAVVSSPFERAVQTVQGIAADRGYAVELIEALRERFIVSEEAEVPWDEQEAAIKRSFADPEHALAGGESNRLAQERALPAVRGLLQKYAGKAIAIGTHGNIMSVIMNAYDERFDYDFWAQTSKPDIYKLEFEGGSLRAVERLWE